MSEQNKRAMIFAPHPDDAEIAMGGTIAKLIAESWEVILADITNGEPTPAGTVETRAAEAAQAAKALGITRRLCLELPNRYLQETLEARRILAECIREHRPRWLFTTALPDAHPDHIHAHHLVTDARFTAKLTKTDMAFEPFYPSKIIYFYASHLRIHPDPKFLVDLTPYFEQKMEAIRAYQSQFWRHQKEGREQGWVLDYLRTNARYFGSRIGVEYAEPFFIHEEVGLRSLDALL